MSRKVVHAKLEGYKQVFPQGVQALNTRLDARRNEKGRRLQERGTRASGFYRRMEIMPKTDDKYVWYLGWFFKTKDGEVAILLPWAQDRDKQDGIQLDRSIAVHVKGGVTDQQIKGILSGLLKVL